MKLFIFTCTVLLLMGLDALIAVSASLYSGRNAAIVAILFFAVLLVAVWKRWNTLLFALHTLAILGLLLRGVIVTEGQVLPSVVRTLVLLVALNGLVYAVVHLRPQA